MRNKIQKLFDPTPEEELEQLEKFLHVYEEAILEKWCSTCAYYVPPDLRLPGFVTDYGNCKIDRTVVPLAGCRYYERGDLESYTVLTDRIEELKRIKENG